MKVFDTILLTRDCFMWLGSVPGTSLPQVYSPTRKGALEATKSLLHKSGALNHDKLMIFEEHII